MFTRILVPLDGSRLSANAIPYATEIASRFGAEVVLLRAVTPLTVASSVGFAGAPADTLGAQAMMESAHVELESRLNRARRYLNGKRRDMERSGLKGWSRAEAADPLDAILNTVKQNDIDLVIMASHGLGGLKRALLGSVADQTVREAGVPVLVVRR